MLGFFSLKDIKSDQDYNHDLNHLNLNFLLLNILIFCRDLKLSFKH